MTVDLSFLTVNTDEERIKWIDLLYSIVNFHKAMVLELKPDILISDETMSQDQLYHTAAANAIRECILVIEAIHLPKEEELNDPKSTWKIKTGKEIMEEQRELKGHVGE